MGARMLARTHPATRSSAQRNKANRIACFITHPFRRLNSNEIPRPCLEIHYIISRSFPVRFTGITLFFRTARPRPMGFGQYPANETRMQNR
jgi:hypothetical protein